MKEEKKENSTHGKISRRDNKTQNAGKYKEKRECLSLVMSRGNDDNTVLWLEVKESRHTNFVIKDSLLDKSYAKQERRKHEARTHTQIIDIIARLAVAPNCSLQDSNVQKTEAKHVCNCQMHSTMQHSTCFFFAQVMPLPTHMGIVSISVQEHNPDAPFRNEENPKTRLS